MSTRNFFVAKAPTNAPPIANGAVTGITELTKVAVAAAGPNQAQYPVSAMPIAVPVFNPSLILSNLPASDTWSTSVSSSKTIDLSYEKSMSTCDGAIVRDLSTISHFF